MLLWAVGMAPLLRWGLPNSRLDPLLFGADPTWTAAQYRAASDAQRLSTRDAGADTDLNPLQDRTRLLHLTPDADARAEILRRYRLYSRQPDEMIVLRALQRMDPRYLDFDPRLYQYGGGYIYLVGNALGSAALVGLLRVTADLGFYLENPDAFARFYVVARFVSLVFGALTLVAVYKLARRAGGDLAGWIALVGVACCPVFITAVLEAKPHLPSACMSLWATLSALDYHRDGRWRSALRLGWQAGYSFGLVLTGAVTALIWPVLLFATPGALRRRSLLRLIAAGGLAAAVYVLCNPYVPYNWLTRRTVLASNIGNSTAMYRDQMERAPQGALRVAALLGESAGPAVPLVGLVGLGWLAKRRARPTAIASAAGAGMLLICVLLGAGKPAEFARFLILPVLLLTVATAGLLARLARRRPSLGLLGTLAVLALMGTPAYVGSFLTDARGSSASRALAAQYLGEHMRPDDAVGLLQEPAPYSVPPLDFTRRDVWLLPAARPADEEPAALPAWLVFTADGDDTHANAWWQSHYQLVIRFPPPSAARSPITWANKPTYIYYRNPAS